jgi:hypothetical protein
MFEPVDWYGSEILDNGRVRINVRRPLWIESPPLCCSRKVELLPARTVKTVTYNGRHGEVTF